MSKKTIILVVSLVLALAVGLGGTLAFLTDRDSEINVFTVGNVDIDLTEDFVQGSELVPGVDVEKDVVVENVGNNSAWVWTTIAIPAGMDNPDASKNSLHFNYAKENVGDGLWTWTDENGAWMVAENKKMTEDDETLYNVYTVMYQSPLAPGEVTPSAMTKVYLDAHVDIDPDGNMFHVENGVVTDLEWNVNEDGAPKMYVAAYAIQTEGFATVQEAYKAYGEQWGENGGVVYEETTAVSVSSDEELAEALAADSANIIVELNADVTYDVAAWAANGMGGASTKTVQINGNGNTLTFYQTNSDWNNVVTNNNATLSLKDVNITNAGHNDGPWNRHDINFACNVNLMNVTSDKALAFKNGATLNNVTIADANTSDTYAIWIQPKGQTVTLNNCVIDMLDATDGRGLKVDNQYLAADEDAGITLKVSNTTFKTEEKSAILIKTNAASEITLKNVNIDEVAADSTNEVWVDEAVASNADLISVTGGNKIVEP
ncbi:MAG: SipW-dependent-type signal peptide-containing protein [Clostridia bacterium]|nr:SipW-dependent-type signal peptide-containing protein [Clostridia bacterium]